MAIPRLHLFEIADQTWCPEWLRRTMTAYLEEVNVRLRPYRSAARPLAELLQQSNTERIVDLCSGAGGPWPALRQDLSKAGCTVEVACTDLYPNLDAASRIDASEGVSYRREPVSALNVPEDLEGLRTMFTGLHHFRPDEGRAILRDARDRGVPFAAFELTHRSAKGILATAVIPLTTMALMPAVKPRRLLPLVLTFLPPLVPLVIGWDGLISTLRTYRVEELRQMGAELETDAYGFRTLELKGDTPLPMTCLFGAPKG